MKKIIFLSLLVITCILFIVQIKRGFLSALILVDIVLPPEKALMGKLIVGPSVKKISIASGGRTFPRTSTRRKATAVLFRCSWFTAPLQPARTISGLCFLLTTSRGSVSLFWLPIWKA